MYDSLSSWLGLFTFEKNHLHSMLSLLLGAVEQQCNTTTLHRIGIAFPNFMQPFSCASTLNCSSDSALAQIIEPWHICITIWKHVLVLICWSQLCHNMARHHLYSSICNHTQFRNSETTPELHNLTNTKIHVMCSVLRSRLAACKARVSSTPLPSPDIVALRRCI